MQAMPKDDAALWRLMLAEAHRVTLETLDEDIEALRETVYDTGWEELNAAMRELQQHELARLAKHREDLIALQTYQRLHLEAQLRDRFTRETVPPDGGDCGTVGIPE